MRVVGGVLDEILVAGAEQRGLYFVVLGARRANGDAHRVTLH
jgi:hypothetical protein